MNIEKTSLADKLLKDLETPAKEELLADQLLKMLGDTETSAKESYETYPNRWEMVETKTVPDSDGFMTDYTWYTDNQTKHIFMFGDRDLYSPDEDYADWEIEIDSRDPNASFQQAQEWFDNYNGFAEEDYLDEYESIEEELDVTHDPLTPVEEELIGDTRFKPGDHVRGKNAAGKIVTGKVLHPGYWEGDLVIEVDNPPKIPRRSSKNLHISDDDFARIRNEARLNQVEHISNADLIEESATEDTVKQGNSWVNKGKEGTHGKFRTKKAADAQRKAMFASGYKANESDDKTINVYNPNVTVHNNGQIGKIKNRESFASEGLKEILRKYNAQLVPGEIDKTYRFNTREDGLKCEKELRNLGLNYHMNSNGDIIFSRSSARESIRGQAQSCLAKSVYENFIGNRRISNENTKKRK